MPGFCDSIKVSNVGNLGNCLGEAPGSHSYFEEDADFFLLGLVAMDKVVGHVAIDRGLADVVRSS